MRRRTLLALAAFASTAHARMFRFQFNRGGGSAAVAAAFKYYVDSANGSNANNGLSSSSPLQTLSALPALVNGDSVGLAKGSSWRGYIPATGTNAITVGTYGSGNPPVMDGAEIATGWTSTPGYTDVWQITWTRDSASPQSTEMLGLWRDGVRPRFAASLADLDANGGWYASSRTTASATVYVKGNPSTALVEITKHDNALYCYDAATNCLVSGGIEMKRYVAHYNALAMGPGTAKELLIRDGTIHHTVSQSPLTQDVIVIELDKDSSPNPYVAYRNAPTGFHPVIKRLLAIFDQQTLGAATSDVTAAVGMHSGSTNIDGLDMEQCAFVGINAANFVSANAGTLEGLFFRDVVSQALQLGPAQTVRRMLMVDTQVSNYNGGVVAINFISVTNTGCSFTDCAVWGKKGANISLNTSGAVAVTFANCSFVTDNGSAFALTASAVDVRKCVVDVNGDNIDLASASTYTGDYNVWTWWRNPSGTLAGAMKSNVNGTLAFQLSAWQTTTGQDAHSVSLKASDQVSGGANAFWLGMSLGTGGPEVGDFRINPNAHVYGGDGTLYVGTFTDGTPITQAGPQTHWDWNARASAAGAPTKVPTLPTTLTQQRSYIASPTNWVF